MQDLLRRKSTLGKTNQDEEILHSASQPDFGEIFGSQVTDENAPKKKSIDIDPNNLKSLMNGFANTDYEESDNLHSI